MKKSIISFAVALSVALAGFGIAQAGFGPGAGWCNGPGGYGNQSFSYEDMEKFHNSTADLRKKMFELRGEYYDVMNQENPDKALAEQIWSEMFDLQNEMHKKAVESGMMQGYNY